MDSDEDDFVFFGTPIEREEDQTSRKKKALAESAGQLRTLPAWKQEVRDDEGRRRFHGAFTGGYSAGYYNTVGSKEGWAPQSFVSSRKSRAEVKEQNILNFLDEDEKSIVDSVIALFRVDFSGRGELAERQISFHTMTPLSDYEPLSNDSCYSVSLCHNLLQQERLRKEANI